MKNKTASLGAKEFTFRRKKILNTDHQVKAERAGRDAEPRWAMSCLPWPATHTRPHQAVLQGLDTLGCPLFLGPTTLFSLLLLFTRLSDMLIHSLKHLKHYRCDLSLQAPFSFMPLSVYVRVMHTQKTWACDASFT